MKAWGWWGTVVLVAIGLAREGTPDAGGADDPMAAPELRAAITLLRSEGVKAELHERLPLIEGLQQWLSDSVNQGGEALRDAALERLHHTAAEERRLAQIVLARLEEIPETARRKLGETQSLELRGLARWLGTEGPRETTVTSDEALHRRGRVHAEDPVRRAAKQLAAKVAYGEDELAGFKEEYAEIWRRDVRPRLARPERHVKDEDRIHLDLDGDGREELLAKLAIPSEWGPWRVSFLLRQDDAGAWSVAWARRWDVSERALATPIFLVADFDGDGLAECVEQTTIAGGWVWETVHYHDGARMASPLRLQDRTIAIVPSPLDGRPLIAQVRCHNPSGGGKAGWLVTALGTEVDLLAFHPEGVKSARIVVRGHGW